MLGKRKRETQAVASRTLGTESSESDSNTATDLNEVFRRHFEAKFIPLPQQQENGEEEAGEDSSDTELAVSEWSGLSETGSPVHPVVEVVDHAFAEYGRGEQPDRARQKAFMSARPPREIESVQDPKPPDKTDEDDPIEKLNLKHDLDLQRLLKESHLLEKSKTSAKPGKERQMALEMRLQALGAKQSVMTQKNMPASHRKGISKKADERESRRRKEAKESGVILEQPVSKSLGSKNVRRQRGVDVPSIGKFSGGTLKLSSRDLASMQGPPVGTKRRGRRK